MNAPFFIFGQPRSRTAWFSIFLNQGKVACFHELEASCDSFEEFIDALGNNGNASTALWRFLPQIREIYPDARFVWLKRESREIGRSCARAGHKWYDRDEADRILAEAKNIGALDQLVIDTEEIQHTDCIRVWNHLRNGEPVPAQAWNLLRMNVQLTKEAFHTVTTTPVPWMLEAMR